MYIEDTIQKDTNEYIINKSREYLGPLFKWYRDNTDIGSYYINIMTKRLSIVFVGLGYRTLDTNTFTCVLSPKSLNDIDVGVFNEFRSTIDQYEYCSEIIYTFNPNKLVVKFTIPDSLKGTVKAFVDGRYSDMLDGDRNTILNYYKKDSLPAQVLLKTKKQKYFIEERLGTSLNDDQELDGIIDIQQEVYEYYNKE